MREIVNDPLGCKYGSSHDCRFAYDAYFSHWELAEWIIDDSRLLFFECFLAQNTSMCKIFEIQKLKQKSKSFSLKGCSIRKQACISAISIAIERNKMDFMMHEKKDMEKAAFTYISCFLRILLCSSCCVVLIVTGNIYPWEICSFNKFYLQIIRYVFIYILFFSQTWTEWLQKYNNIRQLKLIVNV